MAVNYLTIFLMLCSVISKVGLYAGSSSQHMVMMSRRPAVHCIHDTLGLNGGFSTSFTRLSISARIRVYVNLTKVNKTSISEDDKTYRVYVTI